MNRQVLLALIIFVSPFSWGQKPQVIYGEDNRQEVYEVVRSDVRESADSTVAVVDKAQLLNIGNGKMRLRTAPYGVANNLCKTERFFYEPEAAFCSGFLVGERLIATAAHCVSDSSCRETSFVFGFRMTDKTHARTEMPKSEIYNCQRVVKREYTPEQDYALVWLDRSVRGHRPLNISQNLPRVGDPLYIIGHPVGLPTKVALGAKVRSVGENFFVTNTDSYVGNSGSAVFNANTNEVVGILVRGESDFVYDRVRKCNVSKLCAEDACGGEEVTHSFFVLKSTSTGTTSSAQSKETFKDESSFH